MTDEQKKDIVWVSKSAFLTLENRLSEARARAVDLQEDLCEQHMFVLGLLNALNKQQKESDKEASND